MARHVMLRVLIVGAALWMALTGLVLGAVAVGPILPGPGVVMFISRRGDDNEVYLADARGGALLAPLRRPGTHEFAPAWSPDGTQLAFESEAGLYLYTPLGGARPLLPEDSFDAYLPVWSPDGTQIVYTARAWEGSYALVLLDFASGARRNLMRQTIPDYNAQWSPDGRYIVHETQWGVRVMVVATGEIIAPPGETGEQRMPVWSPDGTQIAFVMGQDIYLWDFPAGDLRPLVVEGPANYRPVWSPDGTLIAFESNRAGDYDLYMVDVASGEQWRVAGTPERNERRPAWSPDGRWLAYEVRVPTTRDNLDIYVVEVATGFTRRLTHDPAADFAAVWWP